MKMACLLSVWIGQIVLCNLHMRILFLQLRKNHSAFYGKVVSVKQKYKGRFDGEIFQQTNELLPFGKV